MRDLWLQGAVAAKRLSVERVPSEENVADCLTKYLPRRRHEELGRAMGIELEMGARGPDGCSDGGQWQQTKETTTNGRSDCTRVPRDAG